MKNRNSRKKKYLIVLLIVAIFVSGGLLYKNSVEKKAALAEAALAEQAKAAQVPVNFEEGKHYHRISKEITENKTVQSFIAENPGKIQVVEFFNYGCFWCSRLHPLLADWAKKKPVNVVFYSVPVVFNKQWEVLGKAFYMAKSLGKESRFDADIFGEIHQNHINLGDEALLKDFFKKQGVSEKQFSELYQSFTVNSELARAAALGNAYHIALSPVIVVNGPSGSFLLTAKAAGNEQALISVLNDVVAKESKVVAVGQ